MDIERVRGLIEGPLMEHGMRVDSIVFETEGNNDFLRVVIDRDEVIDLDTVVEMAKLINPILDAEIDLTYILDLSTKEKGDVSNG